MNWIYLVLKRDVLNLYQSPFDFLNEFSSDFFIAFQKTCQPHPCCSCPFICEPRIPGERGLKGCFFLFSFFKICIGTFKRIHYIAHCITFHSCFIIEGVALKLHSGYGDVFLFLEVIATQGFLTLRFDAVLGSMLLASLSLYVNRGLRRFLTLKFVVPDYSNCCMLASYIAPKTGFVNQGGKNAKNNRYLLS